MNELIITNDKLNLKIQIYMFIILFVASVLHFNNLFLQSSGNFSRIPIVVCFIIVITATFVHEFSHLVVAKLYKYPCKAYFFKEPHVEFTNDLPKKIFILIAIAPLLVHLVMLFFYFLLFPNNLFWSFIIALMILCSCLSDCYLIYRALTYDGKSVVFRYKEPGIFEVIPKSS